MNQKKPTLICLAILLSFGVLFGQKPTSQLSVEISISDDLKNTFDNKGRLFLFITTSERGEPRTQTWPSGQNTIFAKNLDNWDISKSIEISSNWMHTSQWSLDEIPHGTYRIQALWDQDQSESRPDAPGNLYSEVVSIDLMEDTPVEMEISQIIQARELPDHKLVQLVEIKSDLLSDFWGKPMYLKASVLLPSGFYDDMSARYPVRYNVAGYGGRYTRISRLAQNDKFMEWWTSEDAPQILNVFLDGEGPFGDSYQLDSDNSGPYGTALITELIPHIEEEFRGIGNTQTRFVDGCSTGGWVSLALQVYYPDFFNGVWSYSPDAIDFENYQLIDIYKDENAYYNEYGNLRPVAREISGEPVLTVKDFVHFENVLGASNTYLNSGGQFSAHTALYSPKGEDGLPAPLWHPETGEIDHKIAEQWKKYDLKLYVKENWAELGPKLQSKVWIWMGDMDNFYLNPATRAFDEYLKTTTNPTSDAKITFTPMHGHCWQFDHKAILEMMAEKVGGE